MTFQIQKEAQYRRINLRNIIIFSLNNSCSHIAESAQYRRFCRIFHEIYTECHVFALFFA